MKANKITQTLRALFAQRLPIFLWGSPGIGKSSIVKQVADDLKVDFIDLRLTLLDPTDLKGIPFFDKDLHQAVWAPPSFLPRDPDSTGILFLDEINAAPPSVQASAYQLVLDRQVGEYRLPDGWSIVAAGNNESDRGVVYRMPSPLANRFVHLNMEVDFEEWKAWAYKVGIDPRIIGFLGYKPDLLFQFDSNEAQKAFATPRSWEYVDRILRTSPDLDTLFETISGAVSPQVATEFLSFLKVLDQLPPIEKVLNGEMKEVAHESQLLIALISSLTSRLKHHPDSDQISHILRFSYTLPSEFAVMLLKELQQNGVPVEQSQEWERWVEKFSYLL